MPRHWTFVDLQEVVVYEHNDFKGNLRRAMAYIDPQGRDDHNLWHNVKYTNGDDVRVEGNCCCGHDIVHHYTIEHRDTMDTMTIGSSCIRKFHNKKMDSAVRDSVNSRQWPNRVVCPLCDKTVSREPKTDSCGKPIVEHRSCRLKAEAKAVKAKAEYEEASGYQLRYGVHAGETLGELVNSIEGVEYLTFLAKNTRSVRLRKAIVLCARGKRSTL